MNPQDPQQFLSPEKIQMFTVGLAGLPPEEIRKAKVLFLRNAISDYKAFQENMKTFGYMQGCFAIIPFFWPVLFLQRKTMKTGLKLYEDRIRNALDVWKDDVKGEVFDVDFLRVRDESY